MRVQKFPRSTTACLPLWFKCGDTYLIWLIRVIASVVIFYSMVNLLDTIGKVLLDTPNPADPAQTDDGYYFFIQDAVEYKRRVKLQPKQYPPIV
ncbi:hypothetical protein Bca52824_087151 [Brassica carinata]|uniref:Uncharacterized protein n=1 Tax=Brassica carinata TaxID=52824 RepID=A0A8X7PBL5_BRACI|nr:hypothetical protein Bca52824_087151 [Brassica carinata]